jgi:hypothetical protein
MPALDPAHSPPLGRLLLVFALGGLLLFGAERLILSEDDGSRQIVVTRSLKAHLARELRSELGREPTPSELGQRVERWRLDEVAYREGMRAGLNRSQAVRNEVVRAYRTLATQLAVVPEPGAETRALETVAREYEFVEARP